MILHNFKTLYNFIKCPVFIDIIQPLLNKVGHE